MCDAIIAMVPDPSTSKPHSLSPCFTAIACVDLGSSPLVFARLELGGALHDLRSDGE